MASERIVHGAAHFMPEYSLIGPDFGRFQSTKVSNQNMRPERYPEKWMR
jgi:hypothetical protein